MSDTVIRPCYLCGRGMQLHVVQKNLVCWYCWNQFELTDTRLANGNWNDRPFDRVQPTAPVAPPNDLSDPPTIEF